MRAARGVARMVGLFTLMVLSACGDDITGGGDDAPIGPPVIEALEAEPWVVTDIASDMVTVRAFVSGRPEAVRFRMREIHEPVELARTGRTVTVEVTIPVTLHRTTVESEVWEATVSASELTSRFVPGPGANFVGRVRAVNDLGEGSIPVTLPIFDGLPSVAVDPIAPSAQVSDHVINLRVSGDERIRLAPFGQHVEEIAEALDRTGFAPDFLAATGPVWKTRDPGRAFYLGLRNDTRGLGQEPFDLPASSGSKWEPLGAHPSVDGVYQLRVPALFDLASGNVVHEIGHRFIAYLEEVYGDPGGAHWPISGLARGVMGYQRGDVSERFGFEIVERPAGGYRYRSAPILRRFNTMELYLMGLLPAEEVESFLVFDVDPSTLPSPNNGGVIDAPARLIDAGTVIEAVGPREPAFPDAPRSFRVASVVLTRDRFLTPAEMAYFDMAAARGEARQSLPTLEVARASSQPTVEPFFQATGGRATLITRIRPPG